MLTDDELAREFRAAYRKDCADLFFAGPVPRPRTGIRWTALTASAVPALVVPAVAAAVAVAALWPGSGTAPAPTPDAAARPASSAPVWSAPEQKETVTEIEFAGYRLEVLPQSVRKANELSTGLRTTNGFITNRAGAFALIDRNTPRR